MIKEKESRASILDNIVIVFITIIIMLFYPEIVTQISSKKPNQKKIKK